MKNLQKSFTALIILVVFIGGYFFYNHSGIIGPKSELYNDEKSGLTSGWKTFSNLEYGFEFEYPEDLSVILNPNDPWGHDWEINKKRALAWGGIAIPTIPQNHVRPQILIFELVPEQEIINE